MKPIIFNTAMVKAILDGPKTQTRRVMKPQPYEEEYLVVGNYTPALVDKNGDQYPADYQLFGAYTEDGELTWKCPYGQVGDRIWVRETWGVTYGWDNDSPRDIGQRETIYYKAGGSTNNEGTHLHDVRKWRPSIFMPRRASRITLEITEVRVEQLNCMTESDAHLEGVDNLVTFMLLWDRLNKKRGYEWESNCWVWVITFKLCE